MLGSPLSYCAVPPIRTISFLNAILMSIGASLARLLLPVVPIGKLHRYEAMLQISRCRTKVVTPDATLETLPTAREMMRSRTCFPGRMGYDLNRFPLSSTIVIQRTFAPSHKVASSTNDDTISFLYGESCKSWYAVPRVYNDVDNDM